MPLGESVARMQRRGMREIKNHDGLNSVLKSGLPNVGRISPLRARISSEFFLDFESSIQATLLDLPYVATVNQFFKVS